MKLQIAFAVLSSLVVAAFASTIADVLFDIQNISTIVTAINNGITALPTSEGFVKAGLAIHADVGKLVQAIDKGATDMNNVPNPLSDADTDSILAAVQNIEPLLVNILEGLVTKQPTLVRIPEFAGTPGFGDIVKALAKHNLMTVKASASKFEDAVIAKAAAELRDKANAMKAALDGPFASAVAAYS